MKLRQAAICLSAMSLLLAACDSGTPSTNVPSVSDDAPAQAVIRYLEAKLASDRDTMRDLLCSDMEARLEEEALSFSSVNAELQDAVCTSNAGTDTVTCTGVISAEYGVEVREFPLSTYRVVEEDGQPRWCGEAPAP